MILIFFHLAKASTPMMMSLSNEERNGTLIAWHYTCFCSRLMSAIYTGAHTMTMPKKIISSEVDWSRCVFGSQAFTSIHNSIKASMWSQFKNNIYCCLPAASTVRWISDIPTNFSVLFCWCLQLSWLMQANGNQMAIHLSTRKHVRVRACSTQFNCVCAAISFFHP